MPHDSDAIDRPSGPPTMRASDGDRERVVAQLRDEAAAGRLEVDELDERTEAALRARTLGDLAELTSDLPPVTPGQSVAPPRKTAARKRPDLRRFALLAVLLVTIWALTGAGYFWPVWPILGIGIAALSPGCGHRRHTNRVTLGRSTAS